MRNAAGGGGGVFLLVLQFPFFLGIKLGLLAFFFFAFVFTASVAHSCFSLVSGSVELIGKVYQLYLRSELRTWRKIKDAFFNHI